MKRLIALIISIAMIASLATGLAVTGMAIGGAAFCAYNSDGEQICYADDKGFYVEENEATWTDFRDYISISTPTDDTVKIVLNTNTILEKITANVNLMIDLNDKTLVINNTSTLDSCEESCAIYANDGDITIKGNGTLSATSINNNCICTNSKNITINNSTLNITAKKEGMAGILAGDSGILTIKTSCSIDVEAQYGYCGGGGIKVNDEEILTADDAKKYFTSDAGDDDITRVDDGGIWIYSVSGKKVHFGVLNSNLNPVDDEESEESDPDVELDFGYGPVTVKTSGKSLVINDSKIIEKEVLESNNLFVPFDLTKAYIANTKQTKDFDAIFLNNDVYKYITNAGKGIELITRNGKAQAFPIDLTIDNPVSFHFEDVKDIPGKCATAIQKKAMNTTKVYAELEYSYVTNGRQIDSPARMYVPVDGEAKVFFIINENTLGSIPCETRNGYCVFNRYFDGTYIICAK